MSYLRVDASSSDWYSAVCSLSPNKYSGGNSQHLVMHVFDFCLAREALGGRYNAVVAGVPVSVAILGARSGFKNGESSHGTKR